MSNGPIKTKEKAGPAPESAGPSHTMPASSAPEAGQQSASLQSIQGAAGNMAMQRAVTEGGSSSQMPTPGPATRAALSGSTGIPLPPSLSASMGGALGSNLDAVRVHTGQQATSAAKELHANAFTRGQDIFFGAGRYQPDTREGQKLLAHELTHTAQQQSMVPSPSEAMAVMPAGNRLEKQAESAAEAYAQSRPLSQPSRSDSEALSLQPATPQPPPPAQTQEGPPAVYRQFSIQTIPEEPHLFAVPEDASREEIANRLLGQPTRVGSFQYVQTGKPPVVDYMPGKAVRVTMPDELVPEALTSLRASLDAALDKDIDRTLSILKQRFIGDADESALVEICLRWSQLTDMKNATGTNYFEAYLQRLKAVTLVEESFLGIGGKSRTALEWLLIEAEEKAEQIRKAIELRAPAYSTGYSVTDQTPEFAPGDTIGRFYYSKTVDKGSLEIKVVKTLVVETTMPRAERALRSSSYTGLRVVVPGSDGFFYGYAVEPRLVSEGTRPEFDPEGHYYWYHPGTIFVSTGTFQKDFVTGGEPERKQRTELLSEALSKATAANPSPLFGLDYEVLSVATLDQKISICHMIFGGPGSTAIPGRELLVRLLEATPKTDFAALEDRLKGEGLLQKLLALPEPGITKIFGPRVTEEEQETIDRLDAMDSTYKRYQAYQASLRRTAMLASSGPIGAGVALGSIFSNRKERAALEQELREQGFAGIQEFEQTISRFLAGFQRFALQKGFDILDENEALVKGEYARYGGPPSSGGVADLKGAIGPLKTKVEAASAAREKANDLNRIISYSEGFIPPDLLKEATEADDAASKADDEVKKEVKSMAPRFPVLADPKLDLNALVHADDATMGQLLQSDAQARLKNIEATRGNLISDPSLIWQMEGALARARVAMGVVEGSIYDEIIKDEQSRIKQVEFFKNLLIAALAIGLGVLSGGTGTVAVLASVAGAGLSVYQATEHIKQFAIKQAAAGTAFDRAAALSADDPSYFWLAVDIATAILDVSMAARAFTKLKPAVQGAVEATDEAARLAKLKEVERLAKEAEAEAKAAEEATKGAKGAEAGTKGVEAGAKEGTGSLASKVVESTKKRLVGKEALEKLGKEGEALKALVKGDEVAAGGLARLDSATRNGILKGLEGKSEGLRRLGNMIHESDDVLNTIEAIYKAFVTKGNRPDQFQAILVKYILTTNKKSPLIFKALGEVGATEDDLAKIVSEMSGMRATSKPKYIGEQFGKKALELISEKLPSGKEGITKIVDLSKWMEQSQAGSIFEQWARKHVYNEGLGRFSSEAGRVPAKYAKESIKTDSMLDRGSELAAVEFKNYKNPTAFTEGTKEGKQLLNYKRMIDDGVKGEAGKLFTQTGKPFGGVEYLFSTKEAAEKAAPSIRTLLLDKGKIFYVHPETGLKVPL